MIIFGLLKFIYSEKATKLFVLASQIIGGYFSKFCGLFRIYEFYVLNLACFCEAPKASKIKCSYGVHKFKPSRLKNIHISLCFVIVSASEFKTFLATAFEFGTP